ncbi:unnamed protein product [Ectocarpus sp. 4 AP-2014]
MSSFHPLGSSADADPLTAAAPAELRFHHNDDDDDFWTPPSLPGETRILPRSSASAGRTRTNRGGGTKGITDPLHNNNSAGGSFASGGGDGADGTAAEEESYSRAVRNNGRAIGNNAAPARGQREWERGPTPAAGASRTLSMVHSFRLHSYYAPTFCDVCSQLLIGIMQQGLQCAVCGMNIHPECQATPCSDDHCCRPPESVQISAGVDGSRNMGVRLKPGYPGVKNGVLGGSKSGDASDAPVEDPLNSDWHQQLVENNQLWVPDSVAAGCMVCSRPFNLVLRRHHCRRCGTCMCGFCSHTAVSDKVLSVNQTTGAVIRLSSGEPVRCCTPCTRVLDQQLAHALQRKGWGARHGTPAAIDAIRKRFPGPSSSSTPFVAAGGAGYAATLPILSAAAKERYDGGGFVPPPSTSRSNAEEEEYEGQEEQEGMGGSGGNGNYNGGGDGRGYECESPVRRMKHGVEDPLASVQEHSPPPPPRRWQEPQPTAGEVPSWLGKSSLGSSRLPAATPKSAVTTSAGRAPLPDAEQYYEEGLEEEGGVWGEESAGMEETTDWSNSGAVV